MIQKVQTLERTYEVRLGELLPDAFIRRHSSFGSFDALLDASPWDVATFDDFMAIPDGPWDDFIAGHTDFDDWVQMQKAAHLRWLSAKRDAE